MNIAFFVDMLGRTRHFRNVIRPSRTPAHHRPCGAAAPEASRQGSVLDNELVEVVSCPARRSDHWASVIEPLRKARDCVRFRDPRYAQAARLEQRAADHAPKGWNRALK